MSTLFTQKKARKWHHRARKTGETRSFRRWAREMVPRILDDQNAIPLPPSFSAMSPKLARILRRGATDAT